AFGFDAFRPVDYERIADATAIGLALPPPEWGVAGKSPAPGIVIEIFRTAQFVQRREVLLQVVGYVVEELILVGRTMSAALGARPIIRYQHDQRVFEHSTAIEELDQPPDLVVGVFKEPGKDLHHSDIKFALVGRERLPVLDVRVVTGELRVLGNYAQF